ncbi:protein mahjong isoform X2 [Anthonomus grandis grandis]|uniref:protein mahjong isoform X2 n=1 Tax=Anthonomus grandis grandis TaxID=2921223 RepID=UPI0021652DBA|nr:protein mahjong isoform X2 [Anthonomus grandis grandis]
MSDNGSNNVVTEVSGLIRSWEDEYAQPGYDPVHTLRKLAEIIELETENYLKMDPDPFDERHPSRSDPECKLGHILKIVFRKDLFMSKLLNDYLRDTFYSRNNITDRDIDQLNIAACRLLLDLMPGLETSVVFQDMDTLIHRLIKWVTNSIEPLQSYATGVLAAAMDIPDIAAKFREENGRLVPLLLARLKRLKSSSEFTKTLSTNLTRPFAHFSSMSSPPYRGDGVIKLNSPAGNTSLNGVSAESISSPPPPSSYRGDGLRLNSFVSNISIHNVSTESNSSIENLEQPRHTEEDTSNKRKRQSDHDFTSPQASDTDSHRRKRARPDQNNSTTPTPPSPRKTNTVLGESSNSSWAELETFMIGTVQIFPPTIATRQILILRYLTPMGEYQEFLGHAFQDNNAMDLILTYVNVRATKESRLAFEALRYLAALLCHKKFAIDFLNRGGLEALLEVPRPSIASTGVAMCFYYLGYLEEAMEKICVMPQFIITNFVKYALWLLECSHDSGRCQAIMFFGLTFQFKVILDEFDAQDGLRKLHNVISTLPILQPDHDANGQPNEDQECSARQIVRHVCLAYRRYLEAHLYHKAEPIQRSQLRLNPSAPVMPVLPPYKACKSSPEEIQQYIELLLEHMSFRSHWSPVDQLLKLGDINLLLQIIALAYEWNYGGRGETVRSALEVLAIACVMPKVLLLLCERVDLPEERITLGYNIIIGAAEGGIVRDSEVEKAALRVLVNSVCAPLNRPGGTVSRSTQVATNSPSKKTKYKSFEELIQKVWDCVRSNSGIMVFIHLINRKIPITDADEIRTLACKGLSGLARCEKVRQIISKLPLFTSTELEHLIRDPILQEKRQEHVAFQKYALELLMLVSVGKKHTGKDLDVFMANIDRIHKSNVVAQTKIKFNDKQLLQLIHNHLASKGLSETAAQLVKEASLSITSNSSQHPSRFRYSTTLTPTRNRTTFLPSTSRMLSTSETPNTPPAAAGSASAPTNTTTPIRLVIKRNPSSSSATSVTTTPMSQLQKQFSSEHTSRLTGHLSEEQHDQPRVTLDSIITEYLTNQHALCKNPMATCPQFNLFMPHKCPDPKPKIVTTNNIVMRHARRQIGVASKTMDRRFIHSRFCPVETIRSVTEESFFTCAKFFPGKNSLIVGDYNGDIHIYDSLTGAEEYTFSAHDNYIVHMEANRTGELLLTTSTWGRTISALWGLKDYDMKLPFNDAEHIEFSKLIQDKIIGTKGEVATIYDVNTGQTILKLAPQLSNMYTKNKATFSMNDELVLTDGVLFDIKSGKEINRLDKLNQTQNGVFHPNGLEIISNAEVWDIRTLHLLKTVPLLSNCTLTFAPVNSAIYAISMEQEMDDGDSAFDSSFKTIDANDYSSIATIEVKKNIYDLAVNLYDTQITLVENQGMYNSVQESVVRLYDVGRRRDDDDEQEEEEDEEDELDDDNDNSDDDASGNGGGSDNEDNDNQEEGNENSGSDSEDSTWTTLSSGTGDSRDSLIEDIWFEY